MSIQVPGPSSPSSRFIVGGMSGSQVLCDPRGKYRKPREVRLDPVKWPQDAGSQVRACEKRSPTSTAGLSEHFAVQVASQESMGWSWVEPRALPQVGPRGGCLSLHHLALYLLLPPGPPLSSLHLSVPELNAATPPAAPPPT